MHPCPRRSAAVALAAAATLLSLLVAAPASAAPKEQHCVVRVVGQKPDGELITSAPQCRARQADALAAAGVKFASKFRTTASAKQLAAWREMSSFVIGTHYDGASWTGSSFSVVGDNCSGGWLNLSSDWDNRVSSTWNGCPRIRHWDGDNRTGASEDTVGGGGNLGGLNNRANSIQYLS